MKQYSKITGDAVSATNVTKGVDEMLSTILTKLIQRKIEIL